MPSRCTAHNERAANGACVPCRKATQARFAARKKAAKLSERWPCKQCGSPMGWGGRRGGNKQWICYGCAPNLRFRMLVMRYGVDKAMYEAMLFEQDGQCAIGPCNRPARSVDHDHRTGRVRGLVCQGCNISLASMDIPGWIESAQEYVS